MSPLHHRNDETIAEFKARIEKDNAVADKVAMILLCLIVLPFVGWLLVDVIDKAVK